MQNWFKLCHFYYTFLYFLFQFSSNLQLVFQFLKLFIYDKKQDKFKLICQLIFSTLPLKTHGTLFKLVKYKLKWTTGQLLKKCHTRCQCSCPIVSVDFPRKKGATIYMQECKKNHSILLSCCTKACCGQTAETPTAAAVAAAPTRRESIEMAEWVYLFFFCFFLQLLFTF